jgi:hypothetical protein
MIPRSVLVLGLALLSLALGGLTAFADGDGHGGDRDKTKEKAAAKGRPLPAFTFEREAAARAFVSRHHPELDALLDRLQPMNPTAYEKAIAELFQVSENLATLQARDPRRYELSLESWKIKSRVQLLTAQLSRNPSPEVESALRQTLEAQLDLELTQRKLEREAAEARLKRLDDQIARLERERATLIDTRFQNLRKKGPAARPAPANAPSSAAPASGGSDRSNRKGNPTP